VTRVTYEKMLKEIESQEKYPGKILDVGVGPGASLKFIIDQIPPTT
jgi:ribosomal protein RSM22 (predicted rRNA methylase)